ncbi:hypothetical protein SAMN02910289_00666 [Lachnospiraceae bacterium RM5]|nr:hypothetical protein SAMN02910289_00666 [Lachnospiraceae bacterium RM5]
MNPWKKIHLSDYENHMSLESVQQLQALNRIMKEQFYTYEMLRAKPNIYEKSQWVSDSPYIHAFDCLDEVHQQMEEDALWRCLKELGFDEVDAFNTPLPNEKYLLRIDFAKPLER